MATERVTVWLDDLDGTPDAMETVEWGYGGKRYEADANKKNLGNFYDFMQRWVEAGRVIPEAAQPTVVVHHGKVRKYCKAQGIPVNDAGRPGQDAVKAYVQAWLDGTLPEEFS